MPEQKVKSFLVAIVTSLEQLPNEYQDSHPHPYAYQTCQVSNDQSTIFRDTWRDMPIFAISQQVSFLTELTLRLWTKFHQNSTKCREIHAI